MKKLFWIIPIFIILCLVLAFILYQIPAVNYRLSPRIDNVYSRIKYALHPPDESVFIPVGGRELQTQDQSTGTIITTPGPSRTIVNTGLTPTNLLAIPTSTPEPTYTPTITFTPIPESVILDGVVYVDQHNAWNYCGPANLTMALKYWGWPGNRDDVARVVKPGIQDPNLDFIQQGRWDKNVMPYEMADFVTYETEYSVVLREGGDLDLVKRLIAGGYPVLIEKGYYEADYTGKIAWLGHYMFTTGYDDLSEEFIVQDAWVLPGYNKREIYATYLEGWRSFNFLFMVVYPPERENEVMGLLGSYADPEWGYTHAYELAQVETQTMTGNDLYFAWFNLGTSHVKLRQYVDAAFAYDQAFSIYAQLGDDDSERPYRLMWYHTGPYWAYYYSERYQDVINLANYTLLETISEPTLEESIYWRGKAYLALGQIDDAIADFRESVRLNLNFSPGWYELDQLNVGP